MWQKPAFKKFILVLWVLIFILTGLIIFDSDAFIKFGYPGIFVFNLIGGPGVILVPVLVPHLGVVGIAFFSALGMALNDSFSWLVGRSGDILIERGEKVKKIEATVTKWGVPALFVWSALPFPYDLVGLVAGYLEIPYWRFFIPTFLGKFFRIILIGTGAVAILGI